MGFPEELILCTIASPFLKEWETERGVRSTLLLSFSDFPLLKSSEAEAEVVKISLFPKTL
jgi:hypothetical protein